MIARNLLFAQLKNLIVLLLFVVSSPLSASLPEARRKPDDWHILRQGFQLVEHYDHKAVARELGRFSQSYFNRLKARIIAHQGFLNSKVKGRKIPAELALLPLIESALDGNAISPARAAGIWQFMPATAKAYGLTVNHQDDDRKDIVKATDAALNLLEALYDETGDWLLAIAAYNVGARRIRQAVAKTSNSEPDFWDLSLPKETREFVARLLALSKVIYAPEQHGLLLPALKQSSANAAVWEIETGFGRQLSSLGRLTAATPLWMDER